MSTLAENKYDAPVAGKPYILIVAEGDPQEPNLVLQSNIPKEYRDYVVEILDHVATTLEDAEDGAIVDIPTATEAVEL